MEDYILIKNDTEKKLSLEALLTKKGISRNMRIDILKKGLACLKEKNLKRNDKIEKGQEIKIIIEDEDVGYEPRDLKIKIVYEDEDYLIVNKPQGLCMHSYNKETSLTNGVAYIFQEKNLKRKVRFINRLDMDTKGLVMVAKNPYAQNHLQNSDSYVKKYLCLVEEKTRENEFTIKIKLSKDDKSKRYIEDNSKGLVNETKFTYLGKRENYHLLEAELVTGKTHQIRASLAAKGLTIVGDDLYGSNIKRPGNQALLAYYLEFYQLRRNEKIKVRLEINEL